MLDFGLFKGRPSHKLTRFASSSAGFLACICYDLSIVEIWVEEKKYFLTHIFMNDQQLFQLCKKYGAQTLEARRKFAGLLPEVYRRNLYEKKGFGSIYHFAAVLAGMSRKQVQRVLQLERKFEDKPILKEALVSGEVSINKLARVASIAFSRPSLT